MARSFARPSSIGRPVGRLGTSEPDLRSHPTTTPLSRDPGSGVPRTDRPVQIDRELGLQPSSDVLHRLELRHQINAGTIGLDINADWQVDAVRLRW